MKKKGISIFETFPANKLVVEWPDLWRLTNIEPAFFSPLMSHLILLTAQSYISTWTTAGSRQGWMSRTGVLKLGSVEPRHAVTCYPGLREPPNWPHACASLQDYKLEFLGTKVRRNWSNIICIQKLYTQLFHANHHLPIVTKVTTSSASECSQSIYGVEHAITIHVKFEILEFHFNTFHVHFARSQYWEK